jgi:iron(III) transport system substrate-binding protein
LLVVLMCGVSTAQGAEQSWDELVAAAKREGKVVIMGPPDPETRNAVPAAFKARFGITMEYIAGRAGETVTRLRNERTAGLNSVDAVITGLTSVTNTFYPEKMMAPIKPMLILPEVLDASKWRGGKIWFMDPEQQYLLRLLSGVAPNFHINTAQVKAGDLRSVRDLLDSKWRGKISFDDPTVAGGGATQLATMYVQLGEPFVKQLMIDQKPLISREARQMTDGLLRGTYPISFGADQVEVEKLRKEGMPVASIYSLPDLPPTVTAGYGLIVAMKDMPHPNATKLFVNWIASKEGLEVFARAQGRASTRNDINEASFLTAEKIPRQGVTYFDQSEWDFTVKDREKVNRWVKETMRAR